MTRRLPAFLLLLAALSAGAATRVRIATYDVGRLTVDIAAQGDRLLKLRKVIDLLSADVIGLQGVENRAALELVCPVDRWSLVIDDDAVSSRQLALAVRKPLAPIGVVNGNAEPVNFLFPDPALDYFFPGGSDVLAVTVSVPVLAEDGAATGASQELTVLVHQAASRSGGRAATEHRRVGAAWLLIDKIRQRFGARPFVLLGSFNDNPDDRSLNILETGDPDAPAGAENERGEFLVNLCEPLCAAGHVSWGRDDGDIRGGRVNTVDPDSRRINNESRGGEDVARDALFDQILIPPRMLSWLERDSVEVFDRAVACGGTPESRASDHLPVSAELRLPDRGKFIFVPQR